MSTHPIPDSAPAREDLDAAVLDTVGSVVVLDREGRIVRFNREAEHVSGRSAGEMLGRPLWDTGLATGEDAERARAAFDATVAHEPSEPNVRRHEVDGRECLVAWNYTPLASAGDAATHVVVRGVDITEEHAAREAARERADELEQVNEELTQFASIVSHDLREPLRVVSGVAELLESRYGGELDESAERLLAALTRSTERMSALLDGLLAYSRVGRVDEWRAIDTDALLRDVLEGLAEQVADSGGEVVRENLPTVHGDPVQISQLLQNLVANALKFRSEDEPPRVVVSASPQGAAFHFQVADNGIGIDPRNRDRVFEMFQRLHTRDAYPGTGVGLAICKKIIDRHGGRIWVEPGRERGTVFHFTLPGAEAS
jgi:PAS domain S-box-containing protein